MMAIAIDGLLHVASEEDVRAVIVRKARAFVQEGRIEAVEWEDFKWLHRRT
jgi:hypothetical protein